MPLLVGSLFTAAPGFPTILSGQETSKMSPQLQPRSLGSTYTLNLSLSPVSQFVDLTFFLYSFIIVQVCSEAATSASTVFRVIPQLRIGDPLSSVSSISGAPEPPGSPHASVISSPRP